MIDLGTSDDGYAFNINASPEHFLTFDTVQGGLQTLQDEWSNIPASTIPEPPTVLLMTLGLCFVGIVSMIKRRVK